MHDLTDEVSAYRDLVQSLAERVAAGPRARSVGAEYDDLVQEGLINVWQTLQRGIVPSAAVIENRMTDWVRYLGRSHPTPYETLLPLEDFANVGAD